jgi:hypothetical protein
MRDLIVSVVATGVATLSVGSVVYAEPAGGVFPVLLTDRSCDQAASDQSNHASDCDPDAPAWAQSGDASQVQQAVVAENVDAPGSVATATQDQDAPIMQLP